MTDRVHLAVEAVGVKHSGGAVVLRDVLEAAINSEPIEKVTVFCSPRSARNFDLPSSVKINECIPPDVERSVIDRMRWLTNGLLRSITAARPDLLLCMSGIGSTDGKIPVAAFVQQSLPFCQEALTKCDLKTQLRLKIIGGLTRRTCRRAAVVITQTPTMGEWIRRDCGAEIPVTVVRPWGFNIGMETIQGGDLDAMVKIPPNRRILYVGNTTEYKNLACLVAALTKVRQHLPSAALFITCPADHPLCQTEGVVGLGYIGGVNLTNAYRLATVFVTASLVESGNLTLMEALSLGTPIIAADRPYAREICYEAAWYFDPNDPDMLAARLLDVLGSEASRKEMALKGLEVASCGRADKPYDRMINTLLTVVGDARRSKRSIGGNGG